MDEQAIDLPGASLRLFRGFLSHCEADAVQVALIAEVPWTRRSIRIYGKDMLQPRLLCWMGDPAAHYRYSGDDYIPEPWTPTILRLRDRIAVAAGGVFNSVLCNSYRDGNDAMGWHSDNEPELGPEPLIASLSLGASRPLKLRPRKGFDGRSGELPQGHGDLLLMAGQTQQHYQHSIARSRRISEERINLTFRLIHPHAA